MSRIYRSLDQQGPKVTEVDLRAKQVGPQRTGRPDGGFFGFMPGGPMPEILSDIERRERESVRLLEEAQAQAELIQRDAYRAGFEQGERAGEKLAMQKIEPALGEFRELITSIQHEREAIIRQHEEELIKVSFVIAEHVLKTTIELQPEVLAGVVEAALEKVTRTESVTLRVSPYDRQLIEQQMKKREGGSWPPAKLTLEADESVGRGGCRITAETGDIDATIETQLRVLRESLWNE